MALASNVLRTTFCSWKWLQVLYFKNLKKLQHCTLIYAHTGDALPSIQLSFIFSIDLWHTFALTLYVLNKRTKCWSGKWFHVSYFKNLKNFQHCRHIYVYTGGALPSIRFSLIFTTDWLHNFTLTSHALWHKNLVWKVTRSNFFSKIKENSNTIDFFRFQLCN